MSDPIFRAAELRVDGKTQELTLDDAIARFKLGTAFVWVHFSAKEPEELRTVLQERFGFHRLDVEDALSVEERPSLRASPEGIFLAANAISCNAHEDVYSEVACFRQGRSVVTVAHGQLEVVDTLFERWLQQPSYVGPNPSMLLYSVLDEIIDDYFPALDVVEMRVDELEERTFGSGVTVDEALAIKRRLLEMRRQITPLRDVLNSLLRKDISGVDAAALPYFQDVYDHTLRLVESIDLQRDILSSVMDAHLSVVSNNLNNVMRKMTVISTLLMTAALVAGVYGMNFKAMPELSWVFGYPFSLALMFTLCGVELWLFRRVKWL